MRRTENLIVSVREGTPAWKAGLRQKDVVLSINGNPVEDALDFMFYSSEEGPLEFVVQRGKDRKKFYVERHPDEPLGIEMAPLRVRRCKNRCVFCFVNQLPRGLRKSLYVKDEDFRMSFLYGNYITLTNLTKKDRARIIKQKLSPLYVSVHTTNPELRRRLLGNKDAGDILKELEFMAENRIKMHTQIVLCPGYNDGEELDRTIKDLGRFYPYVASIAVVPVGVTRFVRTDIRPLTKEEAVDALTRVEKAQRRFKRRYGEPLVYGADELYIIAERKLPPVTHYGEFPQIENGVGMVSLFLHRMKKVKLPRRWSKRRFLAITGVSFYPFLRPFVEKLARHVDIELLRVHNRFFGQTVTVTGLLTGKDIIREVSEVKAGADVLLVPDVTLQEGGDIFLDDTSLKDLEDILGLEVMKVNSSPEGLVSALEEEDED